MLGMEFALGVACGMDALSEEGVASSTNWDGSSGVEDDVKGLV